CALPICIFLAVVPQEAILRIANLLTQEELVQDPRDAIANYILRSAHSLSIDQKSAAAFFLLSHGIVKLFLIAAVLRNKPWAYPALMTALGLLISFEGYKVLPVFSVGFFSLIILAGVVLVMVWLD